MIDLSSILNPPAKPGLLPFALDALGNPDVAPAAGASFAIALTDLMTVAPAPAGPPSTPVVAGPKLAAGRQKPAVPGASLPDSGPATDGDAENEVAVSLLMPDDETAESAPLAAPADDTAPDPQLEPALAWLLPPAAAPAPPPLPVGPQRLAMARSQPAAAADVSEIATDADAPVVPMSRPARLSGRSTPRTIATAAPAASAPEPTAAVASVVTPVIASIQLATVQTAAPAALASTIAPALPIGARYTRATTTTIKAAAPAGGAAPAAANQGATPGFTPAKAGPTVSLPPEQPVATRADAPATARAAPAVARSVPGITPLTVSTPASLSAPPVSSLPVVSAPAAASAAAAATPLAQSVPVATTEPAPQPVTSAAAPARPDRPAAAVAAARQDRAAQRLQAEPPVTAPIAARQAAAATVAVEPAAPRRVDEPVMSATAPAIMAAAPPIAVAAAGGAQQAGIDLTRDSGLHRMIDRIETLRDAADARDTRIRLVPDSLGPVDVSVQRDGDAVRVHFTATEASTRQLLTDAQPRLTELAEARGVRIERATVDGGQSGNSSQPGGYQSGSYQSASTQPGNTQSGGANTGQPRPHTYARPQSTSNHAPASARADAEASTDDRIA